MQGWLDIDRHCSKCAARAQGCISQGSRRSIPSCAFGFVYVAMFVHNGQEIATRVYGIWSERLTSETASDRGRSLIFMFHYGFYAAPVYIKSTEMIATIPVAGRCTYLHHKRPHIQLLYTRIGAPSKRRAGFPCHEVITGRGARRTCSPAWWFHLQHRAKSLAGKNVSEMIHFVPSGTQNPNSVVWKVPTGWYHHAI